MGLENRDYYRNSQRDTGAPSGFAEIPTVCKRLLIANVVVFLLQIFFTRPMTIEDFPPEVVNEIQQMAERSVDFDGSQVTVEELVARQVSGQVSIVQQLCALDPSKVAKGQVWRLITCAFCHDRFSIWHLAMNMLFLFWFGARLERMYGAKEFTLFYLTATIASSCAFLLLHYYTGDMTPAIGASGAIFGVVLLYAMHHPYERIRVYFLFPIEIRWLVLLYILFDLHPVLQAFAGEYRPDGVAHSAHLGGAAFGFLYFKRSWRLTRLWNRMPVSKQNRPAPTPNRPRQSKPAPKVIQKPSHEVPAKPEPQSPKLDVGLEIQLDDVLAKISREGRESLSKKEISILEKASKRLRSDQ